MEEAGGCVAMSVIGPLPLEERAVWIDAATGVREEVAFFGGPQRLFGVMYRPPEPLVGVVICSPIHAELLRNYRREVLLARRLARSGYAVQRFHYRGAGNSEGEPADLTFESLCEDVETATARLVEQTGVERLVFVGTRLGAAVGATAARSSGAVAMAAWAPVTNAERYFREIFRGHLLSGLKPGADGEERKPQQELRETGMVDVLGYPVDRSLHESVVSRRLIDDLAGAPRRVLLVRIGGTKTPSRDHEALMARWRDAGVAVETYELPGGEPWWFGMPPETAGDDGDRAAELVEVTTEWMLRIAPPRG